MLGKIEGRKGRGRLRMRWLDGIMGMSDGHEFENTLDVGEGQRGLACCSPWDCRVGHDLVTELNYKSKNAHLLTIEKARNRFPVSASGRTSVDIWVWGYGPHNSERKKSSVVLGHQDCHN